MADTTTETPKVQAEERAAVQRRKDVEPDEPYGHLSPQEQREAKIKEEDGKDLAERLVEEQKNRSDDDPLEMAKVERANIEAVKAGEAERHAAATDEDDDEFSDLSNDDLSDELERRGLAKSGSKAEKLARLRENKA